jgi:hypothetical protein
MNNRCPSDGYPYYQSGEISPPSGLPLTRRCKNPWHPVPPICPKCGSNEPHEFTIGAKANLAAAIAICRDCRNAWQPGEDGLGT